MKKNLSSILVLVMVLAVMLPFTGCEKLKVSKLKANYALKKANKLYEDEQFKNATKEYETALELNPDLKFVYLYLGTSYSQIYRPMKEDERNKGYGDKAIEYLLKALEYEPQNEKVIIALGDIYDKMNNYEEAEKYYLKILENAKEKPNSYYTLASFYQKNGKIDEAEQMFLQRIELDPEDPSGYHYYVSFLQDNRRWNDLIVTHRKRMYAILDSSIILTMREIEKLTADAEEIKKVTDYMELVRKNKRVDKEEKERLLNESQEKLKDKLSLEETHKRIEELSEEMKQKEEAAVATIDNLDEEKRKTIAEIYYSIGNVCWNWSFQAPVDMMSAQERSPIIEKGLDALLKAVEIAPDYAFSYSFIGLLYREKIKVDPVNRDKYIKLNEEYNEKFREVYTKKKKAEDFKKQLEQMGENVDSGGDE
jgi:tetratricopeptide (TPR) repeat protein